MVVSFGEPSSLLMLSQHITDVIIAVITDDNIAVTTGSATITIRLSLSYKHYSHDVYLTIC